MRRALATLVLLAGCGGRDELALDSVDPDVASSLSDTPATLRGRGFYGVARTVVDDHSPTLVNISFTVQIGELTLDPGTVTRVDDRTLATVIPAGIAPGVYDVVVTTVDGASARATAAVTIVGADADLSMSDDLTTPDLGDTDLSMPDDLSAAEDLASTDLASTDLASTDLASTDLASTDLASTDLASTDLAGADLASTDLASTDLAGADLTAAPFVTTISVGGAFGASVYEAEGSTAPSGSGVALFATGGGLQQLSTVSASNGVTVGPVFVSTDGTQIASSLQLPIDLAHGAAAGSVTITLTFGTGANMQTKTFSMVTLDELTNAAAPPTTTGAPVLYSSVTLAGGSTLTLPGPGSAFLLVMGTFSVDNVTVPTAVGGFPGCATGPCSAANGPGHGSPGSGGGGAGYATGGTGPGGGPAYGDPSTIGLPPGSGGGPGTAAGGAGGGVLRVLAGSVSVTGALHADGDPGKPGPGLILTSGGGGGSGATLLLQSRAAIALGQLTAQAGAGGSGALLGASGFAGAPGRIRVDVGLPQTIGGSVTPTVGYLGAMISADFPTAQKSATLGAVEIVCGQSTQVQMLVDGAANGNSTCAAGAAASRKSVTLTTPITADGQIHRVCAKSLPTIAGPTPFYAAPFEEDRNCRSLILVQ